MNTFEDRMKMLADSMSPEAKHIVKQVVSAEHERRFSENRTELPEMYATAALKAAKSKESEQ